MEWIDSAGGPLILIGKVHSAEWSGSFDDYNRACEVDGVGIIPATADGRTGSEVISLWGEPLSTSLMEDLGVVVQWQYAESEHELMSLIRERIGTLDWQVVGEYESNGKFVVFDAASSAQEVGPSDSIQGFWPIGHGIIQVADITEADSSARIIRFDIDGPSVVAGG